jgi:subtilisin family serine protease
VLGVSALSRSGGSPGFSNRDPQFNDIAAPGEEILSTFPLALTGAFPECVEQGYSSCGPEEYRSAEGTSFAAPQVTAAAAMLLATSPTLAPDQVTALLEQSAVDAAPANGCRACATGRDRFTGAGRLDQTAAIELLGAGEPPRDRYEPNDEGGKSAYPLFGSRRVVEATLDYWNDRDDLYRVYLRTGERLVTSAGTSSSLRPALALWRPGTATVDAAAAPLRRLASRPPGATLSYGAKAAGWYILHVRVTSPGGGSYRLAVTKSR